MLVYQTEPLTEDLTIAGPITGELYVSTTGTDADWVVKLIDVYPDDFPLHPRDDRRRSRPTRSKMGGYQQLVRGERSAASSATASRSRSAFAPGKPWRR